MISGKIPMGRKLHGTAFPEMTTGISCPPTEKTTNVARTAICPLFSFCIFKKAAVLFSFRNRKRSRKKLNAMPDRTVYKPFGKRESRISRYTESLYPAIQLWYEYLFHCCVFSGHLPSWRAEMAFTAASWNSAKIPHRGRKPGYALMGKWSSRHSRRQRKKNDRPGKRRDLRN